MALVQFRTRPREMALRPAAGNRSVLEYRWRGQKVIEQLTAGANRAMQRASDDATTYWREVVWTRENHPYMTGNERDAGRFVVFAGGADRRRATLVGYVELGDEYPLYVEFGTQFQEGTFPLRRTMDWIAPRIRGYLSEELQAERQAPV
jgi:hypothetical protein